MTMTRVCWGICALFLLGACESEDVGDTPIPSGWTSSELAECRQRVHAAAEAAASGSTSAADGLYFGGFQEVAGTRDPTSGLVIAALPQQDGPIYGQMINTYLDCLGQLGAGGTYRGQRSGDTLSGSWTMRQRAGTFGGSWTSTASDSDRKIAGSYDVSSGPLTSMECNNPDGSQFGVDQCYCASPGSFHLVKKGERPTAQSIPFEAEVQGDAVKLTSVDNPETAGRDESQEAQAYALVDLELLCSDELPLIGLCLNLFKGNPLEVKYTDACRVNLPNIDPIQAGLCPCLFLRPLERGHWYAAVGISNTSGGAGLSFENLDILSFDTFKL